MEPLNVIGVNDNLNFYYPQLFNRCEVYNDLASLLLVNIYKIWAHSKKIKYAFYSQFEKDIYYNSSNFFVLNNPIDKFIVSGQIETIKINYNRTTWIPYVIVKIDDNSINEQNQSEMNYISFNITDSVLQSADIKLDDLVRGQHIKLLCHKVNFQNGNIDVLQIINYNFALNNQIHHWNNCLIFWNSYSNLEWICNENNFVQTSPLLLSPVLPTESSQSKDSLNNSNNIEIIDITDSNMIPYLDLNSKSPIHDNLNTKNHLTRTKPLLQIDENVDYGKDNTSFESDDNKVAGVTEKSFQNILLAKCIELDVPIYTNILYQSLYLPLRQLSNLQLQNQTLPHLEHFTLENLMSQIFFNQLHKLQETKLINLIRNGNEIDNKILKNIYKYCENKSNYWFRLQLTFIKLNLTRISNDWVQKYGWERKISTRVDDFNAVTDYNNKLIILLIKIVLRKAGKILKKWFFDLSSLNDKEQSQLGTSSDQDDIVYLHLSYE